MKKCSRCGKENPDDMLLCGYCGERFPKFRICPKCGKVVPDDMKFCGYCGERFAEESPAPAEEFEINDTVLVKYNGNGGSIIIPKNVTRIDEYTFINCKTITNVTIPDGVTSIGTWAFWGCEALVSVTIPPSMKEIEEAAFWLCESLTSITIPENTVIKAYAFDECNALKSATIHTNIGESMFAKCTALTDVVISEGVTTIGEFAFKECKALKTLTIPKSVTSIGDCAFYCCDDITLLVYPNSEGERYAKAKSIKYKLIRSISETGIVETYFPTPEGKTTPSFAQIKQQLLFALAKDFEFEGTVLRYYVGEGGDVVVPNGVTEIGYDSFSECGAVTSVTIPEGVTSIGFSAFSYCDSLRRVTIPGSVTNIHKRAFEHCKDLTLYVYPGTEGEAFAKREGLRYELIK